MSNDCVSFETTLVFFDSSFPLAKHHCVHMSPWYLYAMSRHHILLFHLDPRRLFLDLAWFHVHVRRVVFRLRYNFGSHVCTVRRLGRRLLHVHLAVQVQDLGPRHAFRFLLGLRPVVVRNIVPITTVSTASMYNSHCYVTHQYFSASLGAPPATRPLI